VTLDEPTLRLAYARATHAVRAQFGNGTLVATRFDVRAELLRLGVACSPSDVVRACARVGLRLADA
jgi:hypothetical protein